MEKRRAGSEEKVSVTCQRPWEVIARTANDGGSDDLRMRTSAKMQSDHGKHQHGSTTILTGIKKSPPSGVSDNLLALHAIRSRLPVNGFALQTRAHLVLALRADFKKLMRPVR